MLILALEGGGMRAGFVAGAVMALMDNGLAGFDVGLAVSASVPTLAYCAAGQREEMEKVWRYELNTPKLVRYRNIPAASLALSPRRPVLNIDYLVYEVFKKRYPLNMEALLSGPMRCRFAATRAPEGALVFFGPGDDDMYCIFKACLAVPGCYPDTVRMGNGEYLDGGTVHPFPVKAMFDAEVDKVVAVLSRPLGRESCPPTFLERVFCWRYFRRHRWVPEKLREAAHAYNREISFLERLSRQVPARSFIICPDTMPPANFVTRDGIKINRTVDLGYEKVEALMDGIRRFLKQDCHCEAPRR